MSKHATRPITECCLIRIDTRGENNDTRETSNNCCHDYLVLILQLMQVSRSLARQHDGFGSLLLFRARRARRLAWCAPPPHPLLPCRLIAGCVRGYRSLLSLSAPTIRLISFYRPYFFVFSINIIIHPHCTCTRPILIASQPPRQRHIAVKKKKTYCEPVEGMAESVYV